MDRIRIGMRRLQMLTRSDDMEQANLTSASENAACAICFEVFAPATITVAPFCGHVYCRNCFNTVKSRNNRCGVCTQNFGSAAMLYRLYLRFNYQSKLVCRFCMREINKDMTVKALRCGDVFCERCFDGMSDRCFGCQAELGGRNRIIRIHFSFHWKT